MSRLNLTPEFVALLDQYHVEGFLLLDLELSTGPQYLCSLPFDAAHNGNTYRGLGGLASVEQITETAQGSKGLRFRLPLVNQAAIASAMTEAVQGRACTLRFAIIDRTTAPPTQHVDPIVWRGTLDTRHLEQLYVQGGKPELVVTAEHDMLSWDTARLTMFADADHQRRYPGDDFFKHAAQMEDLRIVWPARTWFSRR